MSNTFEIIEKAIGPVIEIEERVGVWRMPVTFGRDYKRIAEYIKSQQAEIVDLPYARYQNMDWESELYKGKLAMFFSVMFRKWHFFVGMPTSKSLSGEGDLVSRVLDKRRYVRAIHRGPYQECTATYKALHDWSKTQGLSLSDEAIECYVNDPREVEKKDIETIILIPVD